VRELLAADRDGAPGERFDLGSLTTGDRLPPGAWIGPYRVVEFLGAGGMGQVYFAEQSEPVQRRVALKILHFSPSIPGMQRRFAAERHAMGRLDHPNVGKILDAGTTEDGIAYMAMERIEGVPITAYCDARSLSIEERLSLFLQVCRGVDHAHRKFLLHRDIKPSNSSSATSTTGRSPS
jgi:eukaryotic-like serine/threonine-protein kinase